MGYKTTSKGLTVAVLLVFIAAAVNLAHGQEREYSPLSLTVNGGVNFGDLNSTARVPVMQSNFSGLTDHTYSFGVGLQYNIVPVWSLETGYKYSDIRGVSDSFTTTINTVMLKNLFHLDQVFPSNKVLSVVNPFLSGGIGYDFYSYSSSSESAYGENISYNAGLGLALSITRNIDLYSHYEYHFVNNAIDNISTAAYDTDVLNTLTGGIRIKFSGKNNRSSRPRTQPRPFDPEPAAEPAPVNDPSPFENDSPVNKPSTSDELPSSGENNISSLNEKIEYLQEDVDQLQQRMEEQEMRNLNSAGQDNGNFDVLARRIEKMELELKEVQNKLGSIPDRPVVEQNSGIAESLPQGIYVQIFASDKLSSAQKVRSDASAELGSLQNGESIFITRRDKFYQVLIGKFRDKASAQNIKNVMTDLHSDAFIIVFPRPMSLQEAYSQMQIVD